MDRPASQGGPVMDSGHQHVVRDGVNDQDSAGRAAGRPSDAPPLVEGKLVAPRVRRGMVDRPRILRALDADAALTLVGAPAGYGKTTAIRNWCATRDAALAWVTLDAGDNDPSRMWRYVATAVDRVRPGLGRPAFDRLGAAGSPIEHAVDELMSAVATYGEPVILVLDDLHAVTDLDCLSVDRTRPPPHAREHARGRRHADRPGYRPCTAACRPTAHRAAGERPRVQLDRGDTLLVDLGELELSAEQIDLLVERTEGWPAALVLAGIWLQDRRRPSRAVSEFGGDQRFVADYLSTEVLAALDEDHRVFL